jgi:uncharacterized FlaG/YvyC family protein
MDIPAVDQHALSQTTVNQKATAPIKKEARAEIDAKVVSGSERETKHSLSTGSRVDQLNKALRDAGATELTVELLDSGEGPVFHIVDKNTGKELLQIPSEYKLSIERAVEMIRGALFDSKT